VSQPKRGEQPLIFCSSSTNQDYTRLYCKIYDFAIPANELPVVALPPRAAVHTAFAKPMALQPLLAALQTTMLFAIEGSIL